MSDTQGRLIHLKLFFLQGIMIGNNKLQFKGQAALIRISGEFIRIVIIVGGPPLKRFCCAFAFFLCIFTTISS